MKQKKDTLHPTPLPCRQAGRLNPRKKGFVILFTVLIISIVLSISLSTYNITIKELKISSSGRESRFAFFAADTGVECAEYWDFKRNAFSPTEVTSINCAGVTVGGIGEKLVNSFSLDLNNGSCVDVIVNKTDPNKTIIISRGYNTCDLNNPRRVERALKVTY